MSYNIVHTNYQWSPNTEVTTVATVETEAEAKEALAEIKQNLKEKFPRFTFESLPGDTGFTYSDHTVTVSQPSKYEYVYV